MNPRHPGPPKLRFSIWTIWTPQIYHPTTGSPEVYILDVQGEVKQIHPRKLTWTPKIGGLGRCFSFSKGVFSGSKMFVFGGVCSFGESTPSETVRCFAIFFGDFWWWNSLMDPTGQVPEKVKSSGLASPEGGAKIYRDTEWELKVEVKLVFLMIASWVPHFNFLIRW